MNSVLPEGYPFVNERIDVKKFQKLSRMLKIVIHLKQLLNFLMISNTLDSNMQQI
jgi:hypothetical protein